MPETIENLLPHRPPMRFINALIECSEKNATATACFAEKDFCVAGGKVLEPALIECVAQTVAAALGHRAQSGNEQGRAVHGMLVAAGNFKIFFRPAAGKTLHIEIQETRRLGPMVMIHGKISCDGQLAASGDLSVYA